MHKMFNRILVPVNFNSNWLLDKAIQLANLLDCDLMLVHVQPPSLHTTGRERESEMDQLVQQYKTRLNEGLFLTSSIHTGYWQSVLKDVIIAERIDLMIIPRGHRKINNTVIRRININKLSLQTNCPIMTVTRNFNAGKLQNIVVPVYDLFPVKKLTIATYLTLETSGCIYLMGKSESAPQKNGSNFLSRAYQLLTDFGRVKIRCSFEDSDDTASSALAYARNIKAHLIVVSPGKESRLNGWWNKLRGKYLSRESDIPVLTVAN